MLTYLVPCTHAGCRHWFRLPVPATGKQVCVNHLPHTAPRRAAKIPCAREGCTNPRLGPKSNLCREHERERQREMYWRKREEINARRRERTAERRARLAEYNRQRQGERYAATIGSMPKAKTSNVIRGTI